MIGTQRSGSNLLRVMLEEIDGITAPHPPHILQRFLPLLPAYGDLHVEANFHRLVADVCELVRVNPVPWEGVVLDADEIAAACQEPNLYEIFRAIYESAARQHQAALWICKSMKNVFFAEGIERTGLRPYYIYLYRDGRDVALSFQKAIVGEKHIYALAQNWMKDQEEALRLQERTPADRFFRLSYESLIAEPEKKLHELCDFLGVAYSDRAMEYYKSRESRNTAVAGRMWSNVTKPILKDNTHKFLQELSPEMVGMGPFIPHHDTPFRDERRGSVALTLRMISLVRLALPHALIPATTALATASEDGHILGFNAGANVVMPNITPEREREKYSLYDGKKITGDEDGSDLCPLFEGFRIAGYEASMERGDYL